jgi:hypothetical protein
MISALRKTHHYTVLQKKTGDLPITYLSSKDNFVPFVSVIV